MTHRIGHCGITPWMFLPKGLLCLGTALTAMVLVSLPSPVQAEDQPGRMTITGEGSVSARPDLATIRLGVITEAVTAQEALAENTAAMRKVFDVLKREGIPGKDMQTSGFSVQPQYKRYPRGSESSGAREIVGYRVSNRVGVVVRELDSLGGLIDALVADGANQFQGLSFGFAEPTPLLDEARRKAAADAQRKARLYAEALGLELGAIRAVHEQTIRQPSPPTYELSAARADVPVAAGESSLGVTIHVEYELEGSP